MLSCADSWSRTRVLLLSSKHCHRCNSYNRHPSKLGWRLPKPFAWWSNDFKIFQTCDGNALRTTSTKFYSLTLRTSQMYMVIVCFKPQALLCPFDQLLQSAFAIASVDFSKIDINAQCARYGLDPKVRTLKHLRNGKRNSSEFEYIRNVRFFWLHLGC